MSETRTYSTRGYAIRAARAALKDRIPDALSGVHFRLEQTGEEWAWHEIDVQTGDVAAGELVQDGVATPEREPLPPVTLDNDTRSPQRKKADAAAQAAGFPNATHMAEAKRAATERKAGPKAPPKEGSKTATKISELLTLVQSPEGLTETQLKAITGWSKFGGFYAAVKEAGLVMTREKVDGINVWRASAPEKAAA